MTPCAQRLVFKSHVSMNTSSLRKVACHCYLLRVVLCFYVFLSNCDAMTKRESQICILKVKNSSFARFPCGFFICVHFVRWIVFFVKYTTWVHVDNFSIFFFQFSNHRHQFFFLDSWYTFVRARRLEINDIWLQKGEVLFSDDVVVVVAYPVGAGLSKNKTWGGTIFKTHPRVRENLH